MQAYYPCYRCIHTWQPGRSKVIHDGGFRRFLTEDHSWCAKTFRVGDCQYEFRDMERRQPPVRQTVNLAVSRARPTRPFLGHTRDFHFFGIGWGPTGGEACWIGYTTLNAFVRCVSVGFVVKGSDGFYKSWGMKDAQRREDCRIFGIFPDFVAGELPPWRLSKPQRKLMDNRVKKMWWTHYSDKLAWQGFSFWMKTDRIWKAKHKILCLLTILPTCLRGYVASRICALSN